MLTCLLVCSSFGLLTQRWGILWRDLRLRLAKVPSLIHTLMALNNIATQAGLDARSMSPEAAACARRTGAVPSLEFQSDVARMTGRRRDLEVSNMRIKIAKDIQESGLVRPSRSQWGLNINRT